MTTCTQCQSEILNEKEPYRSSSVSIEKAPRRSLRSYLGSIPISPRIKLTLKITAEIGAGILCLIGGYFLGDLVMRFIP